MGFTLSLGKEQGESWVPAHRLQQERLSSGEMRSLSGSSSWFLHLKSAGRLLCTAKAFPSCNEAAAVSHLGDHDSLRLELKGKRGLEVEEGLGDQW